MSAASPAVGRAATPTRIPALRRILSFPVMLAGLLAVLAVLTVRARFNDPDMWWHLKTGEIIWTSHAIPTTDLFSYTTNHHAWIAHEWLSQVLIYGAYRLGGYSGLMLWLCFFTTALLISGYALCSLYSGNIKLGFVGSLVIWLFSTIGLAIRPQMIGYLFLIVELLLLYLGRTRNPRWFFCLPPLFAIWINCHGSFLLGILVAGVTLICGFFDFKLGSLVSSGWTPVQRRMLALAIALSLPALWLNPVGAKLIVYPLDLMLKQPLNISSVQEWRPLELTGIRGLGFLATLAAVFLVVLFRRSELHLHELVLLIMGILLAAGHRRMLFVFGILAAPILSRLLATSWDNYDARQDRPWPNAIFLAISLLVVLKAFPDRSSLMQQVDKENPAKAVEFIKANHLSGNMLNEYVFGGYLVWAAPEHPVFIDGRTDIFEWTGVLGEYGNWATLQSDPNALLDKYHIGFCLLAHGSPMTHVLPLLHGWKSVYSDSVSEIFVRGAEWPGLPPSNH